MTAVMGRRAGDLAPFGGHLRNPSPVVPLSAAQVDAAAEMYHAYLCADAGSHRVGECESWAYKARAWAEADGEASRV